MNLIVVGNPHCRPCGQMKNQILARIDELEALGASFEYISLNELEDKDTFIQKHGLTSTPTILFENDGKVTLKLDGYIDLDTLLELIEEAVTFENEEKNI